MPKMLAPVPEDNFKFFGWSSGLVSFNASIGYSREVTVDYVVTDGINYTKYIDTVIMDKDNISELKSLLNDDVTMPEELYEQVDNSALELLNRTIINNWSDKITVKGEYNG